MTAADDVLSAIFDDQNAPLYAEFSDWVQGSRRFTAFVDGHRGKIRAKVKNARSDDKFRDVRAELATAALLMRDERVRLDYEAYDAIDVRGPDFTVTFRGDTFFNVEVRRIRSAELDGATDDARNAWLIALLCEKIALLPTGIANLLWLVDGGALSEADLSRAMQALHQRYEDKDEDFFTERGFESASDFYKRYRLLSGIVLHRSDENVIWFSEFARIKLPAPVVTVLQNLPTD